MPLDFLKQGHLDYSSSGFLHIKEDGMTIRTFPFSYREVFCNRKLAAAAITYLGACKPLILVYNHYLSVRKSAYEDEKKSLNYYDCSNDLKIINLLRPLLMFPGANSQDSLFIRLAGMANKLSRWI